MAFTSCQEGTILDVFVSEAEIIDRFVGNQLWGWGPGTAGALGTNSTIAQSSPVQTISSGTNWVQVSAGAASTGALKTDGTLWLWGCLAQGQLGNNCGGVSAGAQTRSSPVQTVSTGTNWKQVALGHCFASAIKTDGTLWLWGAGTSGRLGNNSTISLSSPVQTISTTTNWKQVALGFCHSAAIKTDGTLWLWGNNCFGQVGTNSTINHSSPVQTISTGTDWKQVSLGCHSAAIKTDGTLWLWGGASGGSPALGDNNTINQSSPVQTITTGTNWKQVSIGQVSSSALKTDGTLWMWGLGGAGRLGNNNTIDRSSPVQTVSTGTNWKQAAAINSNFASAIKTDGTLWTWGTGNGGELGTNNTINQSSPVQTITTGTSWKQVSATAPSHIAAVTFTGF